VDAHKLYRERLPLEGFMSVHSYRDLEVWQLGMRLAHLAYDCTSFFPSIERYVLLPQVRRAALSVPANIAEDRGRAYTGEFPNFLSTSRGSVQELETYLIFAHERHYLNDEQLATPMEVADHVSRKISRLRQTLVEEPRRAAPRSRSHRRR
jgi:four helix bundle protein